MIQKNITQVNNALTILQTNIDLALESVLHEQSGSIQPQIVPPKSLLESLKESQSFFRETLSCSFRGAKTRVALLIRCAKRKCTYQTTGRATK